ncbi:hypothetical protein [Corynebacterium liangguodongii]|uniref:Uncharacterized protein n=1 Tax=Corynebacterium liangguodongii TaxID=2079535 RepID=A0A2S0WGJ6_9CORY|nr:hypothetical protein [Corynebacterium liangguodongii]AWB84901.1 hypothetical protein C3E79_10815 [Corynebacterium liangguodongii]PWB99391.1 hypothetical protein DF219_07460 [Corynebacterium liangguodongii]
MSGATVWAIASIVVGFALIAASFLAASAARRPRLALGFGIAAFLFVTVIPTVLAVFVAAPNPAAG